MLPVSRHDPLLGSILDGRYQIVGFLGRGGMGNVYLAQEVRLRRKCALKVLHPHLVHDHVHVERFLREAQMIAQFKHPNIVDIFASGEEPTGLVFFAMELLEGEDLEARLGAREARPFGAEQCCAWAIQVARAVSVVHAAGLIHRDLKTSNIFLTRQHDGQEVVKLLDFGIARREERSELTGTGVSLGTPSYMAPEQFQDGELDRRADIYAFGVVLYRLLTGKLPFTGDMMQLAVKHRSATPARPSKVAPEAGISAKIEAVVLKCMAKRPGERYPSMQAVEEALVGALRREVPAASSGVGRLTKLWGNHGAATSSAGASGPAPCTESMTLPLVANQTGPTDRSALVRPASVRFQLVLAASMLSVMTVLGSLWWLREAASTGPASPGMGAVSSPASRSTDSAPAEVPPAATSGTAPPHVGVVELAPALARPSEPAMVPASPVLAPRPAPADVVEHEPVLAGPSEPVAAPRRPRRPAGADVKPSDPYKQVQARASACRRKFKAVDGPRIVVKYWVGIDGTAHVGPSAVEGALGVCLAAAVSKTRFAPKLELSKQLEL